MDSGSETHELNGTVEGAESAAEEQHSRARQWFQRNGPININHYANKKSAAESMLDVALLMANASQLKAVMEQGPSFSFYIPLIILISLSLTLQVLVGVLLIFLVKYDLNNPAKHGKLNFLNNLATGLVFIIVVVNIFITAFGVQKPVAESASRHEVADDIKVAGSIDLLSGRKAPLVLSGEAGSEASGLRLNKAKCQSSSLEVAHCLFNRTSFNQSEELTKMSFTCISQGSCPGNTLKDVIATLS
ncbi:Ninjurin-1 [Turdus rufiventris]|nr:Ninjurin-1 [Turdus rufiventris]